MKSVANEQNGCRQILRQFTLYNNCSTPQEAGVLAHARALPRSWALAAVILGVIDETNNKLEHTHQSTH